MGIESIKNIADTVEAIVTVLAIGVGGFWTYFLFIKNRTNYPALDLSLSHNKFPIGVNQLLIHVSINIRNSGTVLLNGNKAELRLRQVRPLHNDIKTKISSNVELIDKGASEILWPMLEDRKWDWDSGSFEIEPKESETLHADFIIDPSIEVVEFYFYLNNVAKAGKSIGWQLTNMLDISKMENDDVKNSKK